jgi:hypothetical protein
MGSMAGEYNYARRGVNIGRVSGRTAIPISSPKLKRYKNGFIFCRAKKLFTILKNIIMIVFIPSY